jgi:hypothetical protein
MHTPPLYTQNKKKKKLDVDVSSLLGPKGITCPGECGRDGERIAVPLALTA